MATVAGPRPIDAGRKHVARRARHDASSLEPVVAGADLVGGETGREPSWRQPVGFDTLSGLWQAAFDAAEAALKAAGSYLPVEELRERSARLTAERETTRHLLAALARDEGAAARFPLTGSAVGRETCAGRPRLEGVRTSRPRRGCGRSTA